MLNDLLYSDEVHWERNVRLLFGLSVPPPKPSEDDFLELLFGAADSEFRRAVVADTEMEFVGKAFSDEQRNVLFNISGNLTAIEMAPGAGKTFLVEALAVMFSKAS